MPLRQLELVDASVPQSATLAEAAARLFASNVPSLAVLDEDEFTRRATAALRPQPPNFENIVALNRGPLVVQSAGVHPLTPRQVDQACSDGALVVDVRTELQFDEAHIPRSVSIVRFPSGVATDTTVPVPVSCTGPASSTPR